MPNAIAHAADPFRFLAGRQVEVLQAFVSGCREAEHNSTGHHLHLGELPWRFVCYSLQDGAATRNPWRICASRPRCRFPQ